MLDLCHFIMDTIHRNMTLISFVYANSWIGLYLVWWLLKLKPRVFPFWSFSSKLVIAFFAYLYTGFQPKKKSEHPKIYMQLVDNLLSKLVIALFCLRSNLNNLYVTYSLYNKLLCGLVYSCLISNFGNLVALGACPYS